MIASLAQGLGLEHIFYIRNIPKAKLSELEYGLSCLILVKICDHFIHMSE